MIIPKIPFLNKKAALLGSFDSKSGLPVKEGSGYWIPMNFLESLGANQQQLRDFLEVPELNSVINIRARAMASAKVDAVNKETGKPQSNNTSLIRVLRRPNWFQGSGEFWKQTSLWRDIYGDEYIYFLTPTGMPNSYKGMFTLNPGQVKVKFKPSNLYFLMEQAEGLDYLYRANGQEYPLGMDEIIHLNDNRVKADNPIKGTSKIDSLQGPIKNIRAAYRKRNISLNMPIGIISNSQKDALGGVVAMDPDEKEEAQSRIRDRNGLPIITNLPVTYEDMTISAKDLGLFEEVREDTMRVCDAYGVPYDLLAGQKGNALSDGGRAIKEAMKQMYETTIIPDMQERMDAINNRIGTETMAWEVRAKFKHLPVFEEDRKQRAISFKQMMDAIKIGMDLGIISEDQAKQELVNYGIK